MAPRKTTKKTKESPKVEEKKPDIVAEAATFIEEKKKLTPEKKLTPRRMYAGLALSGLLSGGVAHTPPEEVANQAWKWADILDKEEP